MYNLFSSTDWSPLENFTNVDAACSWFYEMINEIFDVCVRKPYRFKKRKYPPCILCNSKQVENEMETLGKV
jgi:anaerobic ribonucleoside-triphosphate reductase